MQNALSASEFQRRTRWYVSVRWFYVLGIGIPSIATISAAFGYPGQAHEDTRLLFYILVVNGLFLWSTRLKVQRATTQRLLAAVQIIFDLTLMSIAFYLNRGGESPLPILYVIPIVMTAAFFGRVAIYATGLTVTTIYTTLSLLDYTRILPVRHIAAPQLHTDPQLFFPPLVLAVTTFLSITVITDLVGRLIREREQLAGEMRALAAQNAQIEAILRTLGSALVAVDRSGNITLVNNSFEALTGWTRDEVVGKPYDSVLPILDMHGKQVPPAHLPMLEFISDNAAPKQLQMHQLTGYSYVRKDGTAFPFVGNVAPIVSAGVVIGFTTVFDDATETRKIEQLRDNFIALISHQLKTPLGEINGFAYNLLGGVAGAMNPKQTEYVTTIQELAARSGKLIIDLLEIVLAGQGSLEVHNELTEVAPVIKEVFKLRENQAKRKGVELRMQVPDGLIYIRGDEHKLVQALGNLVDNAIRYTTRGSITLSVIPSGEEVEIFVSDSGKGMDRATMHSLFGGDDPKGPLAHAPTAEGGTGLGVFLARQLISLMHGTVAVVASTNHGTTLRVTFPQVKP